MVLGSYDSAIDATRSYGAVRAPERKTAGAAAEPFSDLLAGATAPAAAPAADSAAQAKADEIARLKEERAAYDAKRAGEVGKRRQDPPALQLALPVNENGYMPYVTADQQKLMDGITDRYLGRPQEEMEKMWDELRAAGVHPDQLAKSAKYFVNLAGDLVDRETATKGTALASARDTGWMASEI